MGLSYFTFLPGSPRNLYLLAVLLLLVGLGSFSISSRITDDQFKRFSAGSLKVAKLKLRQKIHDQSISQYQILTLEEDGSYGNRVEFISDLERVFNTVGIEDPDYSFTETRKLELDQRVEDQTITVDESLMEIRASVLHDGLLLRMLKGILSAENALVENRGCSVSRQSGNSQSGGLKVHCLFSFYTIQKIPIEKLPIEKMSGRLSNAKENNLFNWSDS